MDNIKKIIKENRYIINNILGSFLIKGGGLIVSLFTMPVYIKYFNDKSVLGIWFTILSVLNWMLMFDLGLGNGLRNKLPSLIILKDNDTAKKYISSTYAGILLFVALFGVFGFVLINHIDINKLLNIDKNVIGEAILKLSVRIVFFGVLLQLILKTINSILYAIQKSAIINLLSLISNIIIVVMLYILPSTSLEENLIRMSWINIIAVNLPLIIVTLFLFSISLKEVRPNIRYFDIYCGKQVLNIGIIVLLLEFIFMIISSTNEFLISKFTGPANVFEYQAYNKIFNATSSLFALALMPIWSAVTKAQAEKKYDWIKKLYKLLLALSIIVIVFQFTIIPFLQIFIDLWLGKSILEVNKIYALIFAISNGVFVVHNVNTSICNGMSYFKIQIILMTFAAIVDIPLAYILVNITGSWIGVILANILVLLPYEILQPIYFKKFVNYIKND